MLWDLEVFHRCTNQSHPNSTVIVGEDPDFMQQNEMAICTMCESDQAPANIHSSQLLVVGGHTPIQELQKPVAPEIRTALKMGWSRTYCSRDNPENSQTALKSLKAEHGAETSGFTQKYKEGQPYSHSMRFDPSPTANWTNLSAT